MRSTVLLLFFSVVAVRAQPNVVLIVADDLGFGDVGYNGSEIRTPNLDRMAEEGVVLDRFYVMPRCSPSRAGLLTGRYPIRMGISEHIGRADTLGLPGAESTLPELLRTAGYETAMVGKWHLGYGCRNRPEAHGFNSFMGLIGGAASYFDRDTKMNGIDWWRGVEPAEATGYTTDLLTDEALAVLDRPRGKPLFLYLLYTAPHAPLEALPGDLALYPTLTGPRQTYAAMTHRLDVAVGRVMEAVRASGEPTLVWFLSDNGGHTQYGASNGALRGMKGEATEGGIRVPSVVWYPEWSARRIEHPLWGLDVVPTLLALAPRAAAPEAPFDGADQSDQLAGAPPTEALLDRVYYTFARATPASAFWLSAQSATWKMLRAPDGTESLYRIDIDPEERDDRAATEPARLAGLRDGARAFSALLPPGATQDPSLRTMVTMDYAACGGGVAPPSLDLAIQTVDPEEETGGLDLRLAGLLGALCVAFGALALRMSG